MKRTNIPLLSPQKLIKIDPSRPLPPKSDPSHKRYPFSSLKVGESFQVSDTHASSNIFAALHQIKARKCRWARGKRFVTRRTSKGIVIWRIA